MKSATSTLRCSRSFICAIFGWDLLNHTHFHSVIFILDDFDHTIDSYLTVSALVLFLSSFLNVFFSLSPSLSLFVSYSSFARMSSNEWISSKKNGNEFRDQLLENECFLMANYFVSNYESIMQVTNVIINHNIESSIKKWPRFFVSFPAIIMCVWVSFFISSFSFIMHSIIYQLLLCCCRCCCLFCIQLELDELISVCLFVWILFLWFLFEKISYEAHYTTPHIQADSTFSFQICFFFFFFFYSVAASVLLDRVGNSRTAET